MASITADGTTYSVELMDGEVLKQRQSLAEIKRPGVDGSEFRQEGTRGPRYTLRTTTDVADAATAESLKDSYESINGESATIVDGRGQSHTGQVIHDVDVRIVVAAHISGGSNSSGYLVRATWTLQDAA